MSIIYHPKKTKPIVKCPLKQARRQSHFALGVVLSSRWSNITFPFYYLSSAPLFSVPACISIHLAGRRIESSPRVCALSRAHQGKKSTTLGASARAAPRWLVPRGCLVCGVSGSMRNYWPRCLGKIKDARLQWACGSCSRRVTRDVRGLLMESRPSRSEKRAVRGFGQLGFLEFQGALSFNIFDDYNVEEDRKLFCIRIVYIRLYINYLKRHMMSHIWLCNP